ncbi:hypothetical protein BO78DRAFT_429946 [Aspergillus sclerotiicarbonarius CBS 121057]|uniref:Suppressor protein SRP40 n=1 Tax=Aspergillus sclerotiicarbonarius (strain CBS 121057 / IBT 28362) TaxID=1448318 RepID=A0A319EI95_ASPSB|nr:hypothetical protein BO78DRAFT_429946 [Aspergillus sclerotiicarbonarius CBS 121057]
MTTAASDTKRLHITPFSPDLLPSVLPASVQALATEISFHCIPTFPENNYGYVTLPTMEADKIKKKLNGSILKGKKFKVDTARPKKRSRDEEDVDNVAAKPSSDKKSKKSKKQKGDGEVLDGYELPSDRQVKRGWTESADAKQERRKEEKKKKKGKDEKTAKSQAKSKYTEKAECLFRTKLPLNKASADEKSETQSKKKKKSTQETVVHEFSKTLTHPSFLRSEDDGSAPTVSFEEGKGWVDGSGNVKENASDRIRKAQYRPGQVAGAKEKRKAAKSAKDEVSGLQNVTGKEKKATKEAVPADESEDWTSSSGATSSEEGSTDSESDQDESSPSSDESDESSNSDDGMSVRSEQGGQDKTDPDAKTTVDQNKSATENDIKPTPQGVHPLEALFKRPPPGSSDAKPDTEGNAQFSFFAQDDIESEDEVEDKPTEPHTPFTKRDLQDRGLRSAAPTPDTALIGRAVDWKTLGRADPMDVDGEMYPNTPVPKAAAGPKEDSEFTKWFWENRGDNNRAWKRRRREAAKEQRQRENRSKGMKGKS